MGCVELVTNDFLSIDAKANEQSLLEIPISAPVTNGDSDIGFDTAAFG